MNPQQELINHVKTCYSLLNQLEAKELSNNTEIARKDELIKVLSLNVTVLRDDLDDVRMAYCSLLASYSVTLGVKQDAEQIAKSFGWGCYDRADQ